MQRLLLPILTLCLFVGVAPAVTASSPEPAPLVLQDGQSEQADPAQAEDAETTPADEGPELAEDPLGFLGNLKDKAMTWVTEEGPAFGGKIALLLVLLFVSKIVAGILAGIVDKALKSSRMQVSDLLQKFAVNTTRKVVFFLGLLFSLSSIGVSVGPFLAAFGVVGFVVGFALQDTMSNFASGVMILIYRPFDVGDVVNAGGVTGKVEDMSLVSTTMLTPDNQKIIVPNGSIWGGTITNITANDTRRVDLVAGIGYDDDIAKAEAILMKICADHPKVLAEPAPNIKVNELADSSVNLIVRPWSKTSDYWDVYWDLTRSIKTEFDAAGISIPYPQQDVHMHQAVPV